MPELPEVEMVRRVIRPQITGLAITDIVVNHPQVIAKPTVAEFCQALINQQIVDMERRGKFLSICLQSGDKIILHLRMTGQLLVTPADFPQEKHTHLIFHLQDGQQVRYIDVRRFGRFWWQESEEEDTFSGISKLGPEPFDKAFNREYLRTVLGKRRKTIKECLLDQSVVAGIGNIYADEILFKAKIFPATPANCLSDGQWEVLAQTIPAVLTFMVEKNHISPEEYLQGRGKDYRNTPYIQVYGHMGHPCPYCSEVIKRMIIAGRSSCYCAKCQASETDMISGYHDAL